MSVRRKTGAAPEVEALQKELATLRQAAIAAGTETDCNTEKGVSSEAIKAFEGLSQTEQAAASLGVHPDAWKPIGWMNTSHYQNLIDANALDDTLARRIEAYKAVASS
jgi:hypothetical protein